VKKQLKKIPESNDTEFAYKHKRGGEKKEGTEAIMTIEEKGKLGFCCQFKKPPL